MCFVGSWRACQYLNYSFESLVYVSMFCIHILECREVCFSTGHNAKLRVDVDMDHCIAKLVGKAKRSTMNSCIKEIQEGVSTTTFILYVLFE